MSGQQARELAKLVKDDSCARVHAVMLAELLPERETGRLLRALEDLQVTTAPLFVNRVVRYSGRRTLPPMWTRTLANGHAGEDPAPAQAGFRGQELSQ